MKRIARLSVFLIALALLGANSCTEKEVSQLLTAVPTLMAPTPSATLGPPVVIDARVREAAPLLSLIAIDGAQDFQYVVVDDRTEIVGPGGRLLGLRDIHPDDVITVSGPPVGDGHALLATRIAVRPAYMPRPGGEAPEPAEMVISRFFQAVNDGDVSRALQLISPAARAQQGQDVWETRLRAIREIQLLSVAQINQATWTPSWQEYLVTARVTAEPGEWDLGLNQRYVDVVCGTGGPWLILDVRREPGIPIQIVRLEGMLTGLDQEQRTLTIQPQEGEPRTVSLSEHTQIVSADGWSLSLGELEPGVMLAVEGLPVAEGGILPDRVTVYGVPGRPTVRLEPAEGSIGQSVHIQGENWPAGAQLKVYVTVPTATFQPKPIAEGAVEADGRFDMAVTIPTRWPDDSPVTEEILDVVVTTSDYTTRARTQFKVVAHGS